MKTLTKLQTHALARKGERIVAKHFSGEITSHKAIFDVLDYDHLIAYEVKSMSETSKVYPVHITELAYKRKMDFIKKSGFTPITIVVVFYNNGKVELYQGNWLKQHFRLSALDLIHTIHTKPTNENKYKIPLFEEYLKILTAY